eukprot:COSAG05_NODE_436_length_9838_cov_49.389876_8_plen_125_part_00
MILSRCNCCAESRWRFNYEDDTPRFVGTIPENRALKGAIMVEGHNGTEMFVIDSGQVCPSDCNLRYVSACCKHAHFFFFFFFFFFFLFALLFFLLVFFALFFLFLFIASSLSSLSSLLSLSLST